MAPDPFAGHEDARPTWEHTGADPGPVLRNLPPLQRAQVVTALNVQLIAELVELLGGEAKVPPGIRERIGTRVVGTRFLYDDESVHEGGSYLVWSQPITPDFNHPGVGTRWQRMEGPRRDQEWRFYEVEETDDQFTTLLPITETGEAVDGRLRLTAKTEHLRRGIGWRRWAPPNEVIEQLGGKR